jgi:hypothetical protein
MYDMIAAIILSGFMALLWVLMTLDHRLHLYGPKMLFVDEEDEDVAVEETLRLIRRPAASHTRA